jgi:hypothetical protein
MMSGALVGADLRNIPVPVARNNSVPQSLGERTSQLHDASWLIKLPFLTDLTGHCNAFNLGT